MSFNVIANAELYFPNFTEEDNISESSLSLEALQSLNVENDGLVTSYHIIRHFLTPAVCLFSMAALCITLIFLHRRKPGRTAAQIYFKCMGFVDLLGLLVLFISSLDYFMLSSHVHAYYASAFVRCLHGTLLGLLLASNWLMTAQAIEKTIAISKPFKAKQIRETHRRCVVSLICGLSAVLTVPTLAMDVAELTRYENITPDAADYAHSGMPDSLLEVADKHNESRLSDVFFSPHRQITLINNSREWRQSMHNLSHFSQHVYLRDRWSQTLANFQSVQAWIVHFIIFFVLPFFFLCLASFRLLYAVRMSSRFVRQHCIRGGAEFKSTLREEARMTILVLCLIGAFFTCQSPFVVYSACRKVGILSTPSRGHSLLRAFIILALALKTDCTFVFHCWLNQRFALALRRMLCSFSASKRNVRCNRSVASSAENSAMSNRFHDERRLVDLNSRKKENRIKYLLQEIKCPAVEKMQERDIQWPFKEVTCNPSLCAAQMPKIKNRIGNEKLPLRILPLPENYDSADHMKRPNVYKEVTKLPPEMQQGRCGSNSIQEICSGFANKALNLQTAASDKELHEQVQDELAATLPQEKKRRHSSFKRSHQQEDQIGPRWFSENDLCTSCTTTACSCNSSCNLNFSPGNSSACSSAYCASVVISQPAYQTRAPPTTQFINSTKQLSSIVQ